MYSATRFVKWQHLLRKGVGVGGWMGTKAHLRKGKDYFVEDSMKEINIYY